MNALSTFFFTSIVEGGDLNFGYLYYKRQKMSVKLQGSWPFYCFHLYFLVKISLFTPLKLGCVHFGL